MKHKQQRSVVSKYRPGDICRVVRITQKGKRARDVIEPFGFICIAPSTPITGLKRSAISP